MKTFLRFLNVKLGLYTRKQFNDLKNNHDDILSDLEEQQKNDVLIKIRLDKAENQLRQLPLDFDKLLVMYSKDQLNAFVYKCINHARNNEELRDLLDRWTNRIVNAKETLKPTPGFKITDDIVASMSSGSKRGGKN